MSTAEDVFSETFGRFTKNWTFIISLRQVADVALPIAQDALAAIHTDFVERASSDPQYKKLILKLDGSETTWNEATKKLLRTGMTESAIMNARTAIDSASLVFAHSVLDDCAWSHLRVCSLAAPAEWEPIIARKTTTFAAYYGKSPEIIRDDMIQEKLEQLERGSLLSKVDLLFQLCTPPKDFAPINNYTYDRERLEKIDDARNGVVHRNTMKRAGTDIDTDLEFISKTANYLLALVNYKYGVQLNFIKVFNLPDPSKTPRNELDTSHAS
jgi:hypothetical protein